MQLTVPSLCQGQMLPQSEQMPAREHGIAESRRSVPRAESRSEDMDYYCYPKVRHISQGKCYVQSVYS